MSEWEILKIPKTNNKERILQALRSVLSNTNFVNDLKRVFICIDAYQAAIQKIGSSDSNVILAFPQAVTAIEDYNNKGEFPEHVEAFTPEELIAKFSEIYSSHKLRFNRFAWVSLMAAFANNENWDFSSYMIPIVDFISSHPCLKSDVLEELNSSFKLSSLFEAADWEEVIGDNPAYGFAAALLQRGNLEFDIFIASLDFNNYTLETIDFLYARLRRSRYEFSIGRYPEAYNLLAEIPPELSPLVLVQRKLNILTAAVKATDDPVVKDNILPGELDRALSLYPYDSHLLFLMADYVFSYEDQNRIVSQLIAILKLDPLNVKVFYLLGKQYLKEGLIFEANIIFQHLILLEPLNIQFSAYAAKASRLYIDKKLSAKGIKRGYEFYRDLIFEILDLNLFEEIEQLKIDLSGDERYAPIFLYARHREAIRYSSNSYDDLQAALALNVDPIVSLRIKREMLSSLVYPLLPLCDADWERHGDFIRACYEEFPDDDMVNYCLGQYLCLIEEDNALGMLHFNKVVEVNPRLLNVYYARSRAAFVLDLYSQAVEDMQIYISNVTHHAPAYNIMGGAYIGLKDYAQACGCYIRSIGLSGVNEVSAIRQRNLTYAIYNAYINCSADESSYYKDVSIKQVIDLFATLNKKNLYAEYQTGAEAFYYAARSCYEISLYERGVEYCDCALDLYRMGKIELPGDIIELKACFFFAQGKYQELIDFCLGHVTYCDRAYHLMGTAYVELKDYYQACNCYISSIELMGANEVPAVQQHLLVYTLFQAYINCPAEESAYYSDVFIKEVIELFATLNKKNLYADCQIGADAFYFAARSCYEIFLNERGMEYCNCALDLYRIGKIELPYEIVDLKAGFCYEQDKYQELIDFYLGLLPEWEHDKANELNGHAYVNLTLSYQALGVHEEANLFCMRALDFYMNREETDWGWVCDWIYDAFSWFSKENLRQQALFYANKFIELNTDPSLKHAYLYSFLGRDYHEQGMAEQAVESYKKSLEFCSIDPQSCAWHIGEAEDYLNAHTDKVEK